MLRQYGPSHYRMTTLPNGSTHAVGVIPIGTVFRMVMRLTPHGRPVLRSFIVEAWLPRRVSGWRCVDGHYDHAQSDTFVAWGGHLARVRCLADGSRTTMADHVIRRWLDLDVSGEFLPMPPSIPKSERWRFRRARTRRGTHIDLGRAA